MRRRNFKGRYIIMADNFVKYDEKHRERVIQNIFEKDVQQFQLRDEKLKWCQALVDADMKISGEIAPDTLQILSVQHVEVENGRVREIDGAVENTEEGVLYEINYEKMIYEHQEEMKRAMREGRKTLVVNAYAGPGAGKTTASLATVAELKKMGYVAEYVSEYAKELVYENPVLLDGSEKNQLTLLNEQLRRMDRLVGKVDIIVTDAPILLNLVYGNNLSDDYKKMIPKLYRQYDNFNFFVQRGKMFEQNGRIQDQAESIKKDEEIRELLNEQGVYYGTYTHETSEKLAQKIQITYNRLYGEKDKVSKQTSATKKSTSKEEKPLFQGIAYPKKTGKKKTDPVVLYGNSQANVLSQMRIRNLQFEKNKGMSGCYIREYSKENNRYENPEKFDLETGKNITTVYLKLPNMKRDDFIKLTQEIKRKGAKYNPVSKQFYITKSDDFTPFRDYLPNGILEPEKGQNEVLESISEEQIYKMGESAGLSVDDLQIIITIASDRGLTCRDMESGLRTAIENGTSKDHIYDLLVKDLNDRISALSQTDPKKKSVLDVLHEKQERIAAEKTENQEIVENDKEFETVK